MKTDLILSRIRYIRIFSQNEVIFSPWKRLFLDIRDFQLPSWFIYESLLSLNIFNALYEPAVFFHAF